MVGPGLQINADTSVYRDFSVAIAYGDTLEAAAKYRNGCSGNSSSCHDQKNHLAAMEVDLGPLL
jgi:hypothetical protein